VKQDSLTVGVKLEGYQIQSTNALLGVTFYASGKRIDIVDGAARGQRRQGK